jgi:xylulokinase
MYFLGYDIGSSSVKVSLLDGSSGKIVASASSPEKEMEIRAPRPGWAEQDPEMWWKNLRMATSKILTRSRVKPDKIQALGIAYQMHGLVAVDKNHKPIRPSIIWCDSRAAGIGQQAFSSLGEKYCLENFLNSPGNFTASKLKWVKENEPAVYRKIHKIMLPGEYIAMKMSGEVQTTASGLSEGIFWNFKTDSIAGSLLSHYGIDKELLPEMVNIFSVHAELSPGAAKELGLKAGTKITYRSGDQPNNAFSLNVLNPGEVAANAGTSAVIYAVTDKNKYDERSRVNTFVHVNHSKEKTRNGILMCINGAGILNSWLKRSLGISSYEKMNALASKVAPGSEGLLFYPFGNGAERILEDRNPGASLKNLHFNNHQPAHLCRAAQEGIVFALNYGLQIMNGMGIKATVVRAGEANMFLSPVFRKTFATVTGTTLELYNTDGSQGAARGAAIGSGFYTGFPEAFRKLEKRMTVEPDKRSISNYKDAYGRWLEHLNK